MIQQRLLFTWKILFNKLRMTPQRKLKLYHCEIRKKQFKQYFQAHRNNLLLYDEVNTIFQQFMNNQQSEIPIVCLQNYPLISVIQRQNFFTLLSRQKSQVFDLQSPNNLQLLCCLSQQMVLNELLMALILKTVQANKKYAQLQSRFVLEITQTGCFVDSYTNFTEDSSDKQMDYMRSKLTDIKQMLKIRVCLKLWSIYLSKQASQSVFQPHLIITMMKTFFFWTEQSQIYLQREPYIFIAQILLFIKQSRIFNISHQRFNCSAMKGQCEQFAIRCRKLLPFAIQKLTFPEIADIICLFMDFDQMFDQTFFDLSIHSTANLNFTMQLFQNKSNRSKIQQQLIQTTGLKLLEYLSRNNCSFYFLTVEGVKICLQLLMGTLILNKKHQQTSMTIISNLIEADNDLYLHETVQKMDYNKIMLALTDENRSNLYEMLITILYNYKCSSQLMDKIVVGCQLEEQMRKYCQQTENQSVYLMLIGLVDINMHSLVDKYIGFIRKVFQYADTIQFQGKQHFIRNYQQLCDQ